jgi:hypothetical protein
VMCPAIIHWPYNLDDPVVTADDPEVVPLKGDDVFNRKQFNYKLPLPACSTRRNPDVFWADDRAFARQMLQGTHPCFLKVLKSDDWAACAFFNDLDGVTGKGANADMDITTQLQRLLPFGRTLCQECGNGKVWYIRIACSWCTFRHSHPPPHHHSLPPPCLLFHLVYVRPGII